MKPVMHVLKLACSPPGRHHPCVSAPEFPAFNSHETAKGNGRIYEVHGRVRCVAYFIDDANTLRAAGATDGFLAYTFLEYGTKGLRKVGVWNWAPHPDDLLEALETVRAGLDPDAPQSKHATIEQLIDERVRPREYFIPIELPEDDA